MNMLYLDANVFVYAALGAGSKGDAARALLLDVVKGGDQAVTACLTVDEVVWALLDDLERREAIEQGRRILELPNLRILDAKAGDMHAALALMREHRHLSPRDAIHAAVAVNAGVFTIVSDDDAFDGVREIERRPLA